MTLKLGSVGSPRIILLAQAAEETLTPHWYRKKEKKRKEKKTKTTLRHFGGCSVHPYRPQCKEYAIYPCFPQLSTAITSTPKNVVILTAGQT
jgi:hypothetical protein